MAALSGIILAGDSWFSDDPGVINQIQNATRSTVTNMGVGGSRSADTLQRLNDFISKGGSFAPGSVVVLNVGGNDFLSGIDRNVTKGNLDQILSLLESQGVKTVLSGAPSVNSVADITSGKELSIDPIYKDVAAKHKNTTLVDSMASLLNQPNLRTPDNIHLTDAGQLQFVETLLKGIGTAQKPTTTPSKPSKPAAKPAVTPKPVVPTMPAQQLPAGLASVVYAPQTGLTSIAPQQTGERQFSDADFNRFFTTLGKPTGISKLAKPKAVTAQPLTSTITQSGVAVPTAVQGISPTERAQPMATFTNQQIADYIRNIQQSGGTNTDIARAMDEFKISPAQVSAAVGMSTAEVQNLYNQYNPRGAYSTVPQTTTPTTNYSGIFSDVINQTVPIIKAAETTTPNTQFSNQNIVDYIKALQSEGKNNTFIASEMDRLKVPPSQVASAVGMSVAEIQNMYNAANPKGIYSTLSQTPTTPTTPATPVPGATYTPEQIADYVKQMQSLGKSEAEIAAEMDRFGVNVAQMAQATGVSPVVIQDMYNVARPRGKYSTVLSKEGVAGFERPEYAPVEFTGQNAPGLPAVIPTIDYVGRGLTSGQAPGSPLGLGSISPVAAPDVYAGVPAAPARPAANYPLPSGFSPEEIGNYINMMEGAGATTTDINTVLGGLTPAQRGAGETAAIVQDAPATNLRGGGLASLAQKVQSAGRHGDTMLAHINPREAGILQALGGAGTINPRTGLPEFWNPLREIRRAGRSLESGVRSLGRSIDRRITQPIIGELNNLAERLGPIGQLAAMYFGGPIGAGIYAGFAAPGDDFNVKRAAQTAALTYAGGQLNQAFSAPGGSFTPTGGEMAYPNIADAGASFTPPPPGPEAMLPVSDTLTAAEMGDVAANLPSDAFTPSSGPVPSGPSTTFEPAGNIPTIDVTQSPDPNVIAPPTSAPPPPSESLANLAGSIYEMGVEGAKAVGIDTPFKAAVAATMGTSLVQGQREREKFKEEQARIQRETAERRRRYREQAEGILSLYPIRFAAQGGMMDEPDEGKEYDFAGGGMPPRFLSGGGDGMSDSIPAMIGEQQPARLADGEFVIPADVVSGLGNGSSKAGAKQLYAMMDRIRKARTGTTKQGREINPRRFMPA